MNLNELFVKQQRLDEYIMKEKNEKESQIINKITAMSVELGEMMNEFPRLFKFWSNKENDRDAGLVEYVDNIHFALSIGNELGYTSHDYNKTTPRDIRLTYLGIQNILAILSVDQDKRHLETLFNNLITLGYQLGFTEQDVIQAYDDKNKENYKRQENGY